MYERPQDIITVPETVQESRVYQALVTVRNRLPEAFGSSRLATLGESVNNTTRDSWIFGWLTKEPEPEVIVIDLRETWTVGPFIAILDWVFEHLAVAYHDSRLEQLSTTLQMRLYRSPVRILSTILFALFLPVSIWNAARTGVSTTTVALLLMTVGSVLGTLVDLSWPEIRETRVVQLLIAAFEPPEPPEQR